MKVQASLTVRLIKEGLIFYPAGKWDKMTTYERTMETCPFVLYDTGKPDTDLYYYLNKEIKVVGNPNNINPKSDYAANGSKATWRPLENVGYVFAKFAMIDHALLAGAVAYQNKMFSQAGTLNGVASTNYTHPDFTANIVIDWLKGTINAIKGTFSGVLSGVTGTFSWLSAPGGGAEIGLSSDKFWFNGDMQHQGAIGKGEFLAKSIFVRNKLGHASLNNYYLYNKKGSYPYIQENFGTVIDTYNGGRPVDSITVNSDANIRMGLTAATSETKLVTIANTNNLKDIRIVTIGGDYTLRGGAAVQFLYVKSTLTSPSKSGWMAVGHDNNW